jgi:hypothetical protein
MRRLKFLEIRRNLPRPRWLGTFGPLHGRLPSLAKPRGNISNERVLLLVCGELLAGSVLVVSMVYAHEREGVVLNCILLTESLGPFLWVIAVGRIVWSISPAERHGVGTGHSAGRVSVVVGKGKCIRAPAVDGRHSSSQPGFKSSKSIADVYCRTKGSEDVQGGILRQRSTPEGSSIHEASSVAWPFPSAKPWVFGFKELSTRQRASVAGGSWRLLQQDNKGKL